jgi:hypothetical protein
MPLTDGQVHLKDVARLRNLGMARSIAAQEMYDIYKRTGTSVDRRHFELLARNAHNFVKIDKVNGVFPYKRGEVIPYNKLVNAINKLNTTPVPIASADGYVLAEPILDFTVGTEINQNVIQELKNKGIKKVKCTSVVEVSPHTTRLTSAIMDSTDWIAKLNHRYLKQTIKDAATTGHSNPVHGYSPITSYAVGSEMTQDKFGKY